MRPFAPGARMNWQLLFTGTRSLGWTISVVLVVLLTLMLCVWLSRLERQLVARRTGVVLMILRLLVLCALLLTLLQPVLTRTWDISQRGRLVVAVDASGSMETMDRHASDAEKLRWAQALGMLGNEQTTPLIDDWVQSLEAGEQPDWSGRGHSADGVQNDALAEGRRRQVAAVLEELGRMPRVELVRRLLQAPPHDLLKQLSQVMPVEVRLFATEQKIVESSRLDQALQDTRSELIPSGTDAVQMLSSLLAEESGPQLRGVVLLSDGRQTAAGDPVAEARRMGSLGVPVYSIPIGSRLTPRDLSLAAVEVPESVFVNDKAQVQVTIGTSGFEGQELTVRLEHQGLTIDQQRVTPAGDTAVVRFEIPADTVGQFEYQIATDVLPGELRDDNNHRDISLQVVDNKSRVLLVDGDARWEFRYLRNLLERDAQVDLSSVLFRQPHLQLLNDTFIERTLPTAEELQEQLVRTDILVMGDVRPEDVDERTWTLIEQAVANDGLTLVVIPGRRHLPETFASQTLLNLLPVGNFQQRLAEKFSATAKDQEQSAFHLLPTPEAGQLPMFQLPPQGGVPVSLESLPGHPWAFTGTPRPSAVVWAWAMAGAGRDLKEAAIVHQYYGFGQVVWMGVDSTWRWRLRAGDTRHHRFWGQLVRWAARNKAAAGNDQVRFTLSDIVIDETESVEAVARFSDQVVGQLQDAVVEVVTVPVDREPLNPAHAASNPPQANEPQPESAMSVTERVTVLQRSAEHPERYSGRLPRLPSGTWKAQLRVRGGQLPLNQTIESPLLVQQRLSGELANVSCHRELLMQLAQLSGGQMIEPWHASELVNLVQPETQTDDQLEEHSLWDHWATLLLFFTLLTGEWVVRKLNGLP